MRAGSRSAMLPVAVAWVCGLLCIVLLIMFVSALASQATSLEAALGATLAALAGNTAVVVPLCVRTRLL